MLSIFISLIIVAGLFALLGFYEDPERDKWGDRIVKWKLRKRQLLSLFGLIFLVFGFLVKIPANNVGIVYSPFGGTKEETLSEGLKVKNPLDKVYKFSTETQTTIVENLTTQTKDAQYVTSILNVKYKVDPSNAYLVFKQYRTIDRMSADLIKSTTQRVLEHSTTNYNVIDILGEKRNELYSELEVELAKELALYGVEFISITIDDMDAGEKLENAIADEAVAKKAVETAEQNLLKAETEAKQKSVQAKAEQEAAKIEAETKLIEAEAEKKANEMLDQSLSDDILQKLWIEKWDGKQPTYYAGSGEGAGIMFNVGTGTGVVQ
jgi:regulator of protease activity HflC (stomatin/prohibitin superfamily)